MNKTLIFLMLILIIIAGCEKSATKQAPAVQKTEQPLVKEETEVVAISEAEIKQIEKIRTQVTLNLMAFCQEDYKKKIKDAGTNTGKIIDAAKFQANCVQLASRAAYSDAVPDGKEDYCKTLETQASIELCQNALTKSGEEWEKDIEGLLKIEIPDDTRLKNIGLVNIAYN